MTIQERLFELQDQKYAAFHAGLIPNVSAESVIGVRVPDARKLAKELVQESVKGTTSESKTEKNRQAIDCKDNRRYAAFEGELGDFLNDLPHKYYDENLLHGQIIAEIKDYNSCIKEIEKFLPYVNNWAVCDYMSPKVFKKHKPELLEKIFEWSASSDTYTCRFGIEMLMVHFLDEEFKPEFLEIATSVDLSKFRPATATPSESCLSNQAPEPCSNDYYIRMMIAWFFATALAKQWDAAFPYIEQGRLETWTHNKAIQKARESYRITKEQKELLKSYKK